MIQSTLAAVHAGRLTPMKPHEPPVQATFRTWLKTSVPSEKVKKGLLEEAGLAWARGVDYHVAIGSALTRSGQPILVHIYMGELFVFLLQDPHARIMGLKPAATASCTGRERVGPPKPPQLNLLDVVIPDSTALDVTRPIRGHCIFDVAPRGYLGAGAPMAPAPFDDSARGWGMADDDEEQDLPVALTLEVVLRDRSSSSGICFTQLIYNPPHPVQLAAGGRFDFEFTPLRLPSSPASLVAPQIAAAFIAFRQVPQPDQYDRMAVPVSRPLAVLLTLR